MKKYAYKEGKVPSIFARWQRSKKPRTVYTCKQHDLEFYKLEESERHSKQFPHLTLSGTYEIIIGRTIKNFSSEKEAMEFLIKHGDWPDKLFK